VEEKMEYDVLFEVSFDEKEKDYQKYLPDKKFNLMQTENELEDITEDFCIRRVKFIGTLNEQQAKEFIEDYGGYARVEPCLADVLVIVSYFPVISPAIVIYDELPYPPIEGREIFITPVPETEEEFNKLKSLAEKDDNGKSLIDYITDKLFED
jgi:hypothetical protein